MRERRARSKVAYSMSVAELNELTSRAKTAATTGREINGLLFAHGTRLRLAHTANVGSRFSCLMEADESDRYLRRARARGLKYVGWFHSHPLGGPTPSRTDIRSTPPGVLAMILDAVEGDCRIWRVSKGVRRRKTEEVALWIEEPRSGINLLRTRQLPRKGVDELEQRVFRFAALAARHCGRIRSGDAARGDLPRGIQEFQQLLRLWFRFLRLTGPSGSERQRMRVESLDAIQVDLSRHLNSVQPWPTVAEITNEIACALRKKGHGVMPDLLNE